MFVNGACAQVALEWLFEHADEPDELVVTDEDVVMADVIATSKSQTNANVTDAEGNRGLRIYFANVAHVA